MMGAPQRAALLGLLLTVPLAWCDFDCGNIELDGLVYKLKDLGGARSVVTSQFKGFSYLNTTFTLDICSGLNAQGTESKLGCPAGTRVCAIQRLFSLDSKDGTIEDVIAIAGALSGQGGGELNAQTTRLQRSNDDPSSRDGLRLVLQGGAHWLKSPAASQRSQRAVIDFLCDNEKTGLEGFRATDASFTSAAQEVVPLSATTSASLRGRSSDADQPVDSHKESQLKSNDSALIWQSYEAAKAPDDKIDELRLVWHTKAVCPQNVGGDEREGSGKSSWGLFTWLVLLVFVGAAAYLIFSAWLNYHRHGARGWDLMPHGDMVRDVPYLLRDWTRKVLNTVQGAGSRGGYSAV